MDKVATPILYSVGNIVSVKWGRLELPGVILEVDHENAAAGGIMNYKVAVIMDGEVKFKHYYMNEELTLLDDGTAVKDSPESGEVSHDQE